MKKMNKKAQDWQTGGIALIIIIFVAMVLWLIIAGINTLWQGYKFNKEIGDYCELSYEASDISQKISYIDQCSQKLHSENMQGNAVWIFFKPQNNMIENYKVLDSLVNRTHDLQNMNTSSWEYQQGLQQVEDEIEYFVLGTPTSSGHSGAVINYFGRMYCFDHSIGKIWCF
jgi:hypothetical protein